MQKIDLKKELKHLYLPSAKAVVQVDVPARRLLMDSPLDFHASKLEETAACGDTLRLVFSGALVHRSAGRPGINTGAADIQPAELVFSRALWSASIAGCSGSVSDGRLGNFGGKLSRPTSSKRM